MELKTAQIIMMAKQPQNFGEFETFRSAINTYMSYYSGTDIEFYDTPRGREVIDIVVFEALCDYINGCDCPSLVLREIKEAKEFREICGQSVDITEAILSSLSQAQVMKSGLTKDDQKYVNGFTEENTRVLSPEDFKEEPQ